MSSDYYILVSEGLAMKQRMQQGVIEIPGINFSGLRGTRADTKDATDK